MNKQQLTCIICPQGCLLSVEVSSADFSAEKEDKTGVKITGNKCKRGIDYAREEIFSPKRIVTATCTAVLSNSKDSNSHLQRIPVRTTSPCPKESINELLKDIYSVRHTLPVKSGQKLLSNWKGSSIDVIATRTFD